jgi:hypothetical protein
MADILDTMVVPKAIRPGTKGGHTGLGGHTCTGKNDQTFGHRYLLHDPFTVFST